MSVLRCLTLNLWGAEPPLEAADAPDRRGHPATWPPTWWRCRRCCEFPDLPNQAETLARATGLSFVFAPGHRLPGRPRGAGHPVAAADRWPTSRGSCPTPPPQERRILLSAGLTVGDRTVWVHTTHLNYRLTHGRQREDQVLAIDDAGGQPQGRASPRS